MGSFKLGGISLKGMFSKPATKMYPVIVPDYYERTAGHVENKDMKACILCGICQRRCPTSCIVVDKAKETWSINPFDCVSCNSCVRECPKQCLVMERTYTQPATSKEWVVMKKPELTPEEKAAKAKADAEKAARVKAAKEAAAAKKAAAAKEAGASDAPAAKAEDAKATEPPAAKPDDAAPAESSPEAKPEGEN